MPAPRLPAAAAPRCVASLLAGSDSSAWRRWLDLLDVRGSWLVWDGGIPRLPAAAAPRCVASLLACCAGKRFAFPQLRTLAGSNSSACPQESALGRYGLRALSFNGWDGGIRTPNSRHQKPEFYR